jgi:hypothetical protein
MIRKSVQRFSEKIMRKQKGKAAESTVGLGAMPDRIGGFGRTQGRPAYPSW